MVQYFDLVEISLRIPLTYNQLLISSEAYFYYSITHPKNPLEIKENPAFLLEENI